MLLLKVKVILGNSYFLNFCFRSSLRVFPTKIIKDVFQFTIGRKFLQKGEAACSVTSVLSIGCFSAWIWIEKNLHRVGVKKWKIRGWRKTWNSIPKPMECIWARDLWTMQKSQLLDSKERNSDRNTRDWVNNNFIWTWLYQSKLQIQHVRNSDKYEKETLRLVTDTWILREQSYSSE